MSKIESRNVKDAVLFLKSASGALRGEGVNPTTTKQAERDLLALRKRLSALRLHVAKMSKTAIDAMGIDRVCLRQLVRMEGTAERALERLRAQPGRPRKQRADRITAVAASVFLWLTGTLPTLRTNSEGVAYGPFIDFLKAVFEACKITASAEAQVKAFQKKYRPPRSGEGYGENSAKNSN